MSAVFLLELRSALARRRVLVLNIVIPLALVAPVALGGAPAFHAAAVYAVLFTLFGTFGQAIPLVRDGERGLLARFTLAGLPPRALVVGRVLAGALTDLVQLTPALALIALAGPGEGLLGAFAALAAALLAANALGAWVAALARSIAEAALFAAVLALLALHASGVFRTPAPGSAAAALEPFLPFSHLHHALLHLAGGTTTELLTSALVGLASAAIAFAVTVGAGAWLGSRVAVVGQA